MRKKSCQELAELGWKYGIWDAKEQKWDALSVEVGDAEMWLEETEAEGRYKVYTLKTGEEYK